MSELVDLRKEIKAWEHSFHKENGRVPQKNDIKQNRAISKLYKQYRDLKKKDQAPSLTKNLDIDVHIGDSDDDLSGSETENKYNVAVGVQLGPTPQANGKILSLFDTRMTPPESSPLKAKQKVKTEEPEENDVFKTPQKTRVVDINAQLQAAAQKSAQSIIKSSPNVLPIASPVRQTPRYMSRNYFISDGPVTPSKPTVGFQVSPSPLKPQRLFNYGTKRLADIFNEVQSIKENIVPPDEPEQQVERVVEVVESVVGKTTKKAKTQKRTTRRWKIKPRPELETGIEMGNQDVHAAIQHIEEKQQQEHEKYLDSEEDDDENENIKPQPKQAKGKMVKPISMNYQRLKINDPRAKAFKRRMKR